MENEKEIKIQEKTEIIEEIVTELVSRMGFVSVIEIKKSKSDEEDVVCNIKTEESNYLIGQYGVNLQALQHIARVMVRKKIDGLANFVLDVNCYRQEKNEAIAIMAKEAAEKAILEGRTVVLRSMSPYERRLVHMELSQNEKVTTESVGEGEDRKVAIKPVSLS